MRRATYAGAGRPSHESDHFEGLLQAKQRFLAELHAEEAASPTKAITPRRSVTSSGSSKRVGLASNSGATSRRGTNAPQDGGTGTRRMSHRWLMGKSSSRGKLPRPSAQPLAASDAAAVLGDGGTKAPAVGSAPTGPHEDGTQEDERAGRVTTSASPPAGAALARRFQSPRGTPTGTPSGKDPLLVSLGVLDSMPNDSARMAAKMLDSSWDANVWELEEVCCVLARI
eukprot:3097562-Prymnesium_polylepis.1